MTPSAQERWLSVIEASDAVLSEAGESDDPVALRRAAEALARKGSALRNLGRLDQAVNVWDDLISRYKIEPSPRASLVIMTASYWKARDLEQMGRHRESLAAVTELVDRAQGQAEDDALNLLVVRALTVRARALAALGSVNEAVDCAEEILARAGGADEPELRWWAAWALEHESRSLIASGHIDQALAASVRLVAQLSDAPPDSLVSVAEIVNHHSLLLLQLGAPNPTAIARFILLVLINTTGHALSRGVSRFKHHLPDPVLRSGERRELFTDKPGIIASVRNSRRRAEQARAASHAVIAKIGASEDPDLRRCAAAAEYIIGLALVVLGELRSGMRSLNTFLSRDDLGAIQAFQWITTRSVQDPSVLSELGGISNAAVRARMLGSGDPAITKIAYEDSIADRKANSAHPTLSRLLARLLRPRIDKKASKGRPPSTT